MIAAVAEILSVIGRVVVLARSEKLLTQNRNKFSAEYQPRIGIFCAGLGEKDLTKQITIASAQSIAGQSMDGVIAILVDECDEISSDEESQYQTFFVACGNPPVLGFTATPFRTGSGKITWGEEIISIPLQPIMDAGYLTPPTNKVGAKLDLSGVEVRLGDYVQSQLDKVYDDPELLALSVRKIKQYSTERNSVLVFCQSLRHADILANAMEHNGMPCVTVSGDTDKEELEFILADFEDGRIKYLLNVMLLTRGYDMPCVDMIAVLRATKSKRLWEQILYRGTRLKPGKKDFLVLDLGNNFAEHGALGSPYNGDNKGKDAATPKGRICPECEEYAPLLSKQCPDCGYEFPEAERPKVDHARKEDTTSKTVYDGEENTYAVNTVTYKHKKSKTGNEVLVVEYWCNGVSKYGSVCDYLLPFHASEWVRGKVHALFRQGGNNLGSPCNTYTMNDLLWHAEQLAAPDRIEVIVENGYQKVKKRIYDAKQLTLEEVLDGDYIAY